MLSFLMISCLASGCGGGAARDPYATLANNRASPTAQLDAMNRLDTPTPAPRYLSELTRIVLSPKYLESTRKAAFSRLLRHDPDQLDEALSTSLSRIEPADYRAWIITRLGELDRKQLTKAIIRSWAMPTAYWNRDQRRAEPEALALMYGGQDKVPVALLDTLLNASPTIERNLRARCWELMVTTGQTDLLIELINDDELTGSDPLLLDMRRSVNELGVVPKNKEEILWIRELQTPAYERYWKQMSEAFALLEESRRSQLSTRELAVAVAAAQHRPELLELDDQALYDLLKREIGQHGTRYNADFSGWKIDITERLSDVRDKVTWGDLLAMLLAREALRDTPFQTHLFDQADRDMIDTTTEFGGVIRLDAQGRFELVEHPARSRISDEKFLAPQSLFDDGYTALFHFHNHAQKYDNRRHAGPHMGDLQYAEETGANCLVFTFVKPDLLNVDFYRSDAVVVDLGTIQRPNQG
ncbi:MAG: hypothetical protein CMJ57_02460 [Planctomycetaceae bacterium]|nr:hypothetical protein [Planctomycetaceae bacterium]